MDELRLDLKGIMGFVSESEIKYFDSKINKCNEKLHKKTGKGNDFLGWIDLPFQTQVDEILNMAYYLRKNIDTLVVIGIGGSYLGAKAVLESLSNSFGENNGNPEIIFAGHNISEDYLFDLLHALQNRNWAICVISKSGTTTEPALAFRVLKQALIEKYKSDSKDRIIAITDKKKGALRQLADIESYKTFVIPDDVGGRYSVLTPVGLFPIAVAGFDIKALLEGAKNMADLTNLKYKGKDNLAGQYASARNALYTSGKKVELLVNFNPKLHFIAEWWKQLFGESEGKENKGIFPTSVDFTTDLHSMGQYIQEGERIIFETAISVKNPYNKLVVPADKQNLDKLNYLSGKRVNEINKMAELGTSIAHIDGGVPNIKIEIEKIDEFNLGQLIYFFEKACGISGYMLEVNPFNQPGVEAYKKNMFALLEKPGFEEQTKQLKDRMK